jgi:riboflavin synthase
VVQGHVDATGTLISLKPTNADADPKLTDWWLRVVVPASVGRYVVEKGSIAIEGISLTVARFEPGGPGGDIVSVAIIPHTYAATNLHSLQAGQALNIEADVLLKFAEQQLAQQKKEEFEISLEYLVANGY